MIDIILQIEILYHKYENIILYIILNIVYSSMHIHTTCAQFDYLYLWKYLHISRYNTIPYCWTPNTQFDSIYCGCKHRSNRSRSLSIRAPFVPLCRSNDIVTTKAAKATISLQSFLI
jgi:hypothetical protein